MRRVLFSAWVLFFACSLFAQKDTIIQKTYPLHQVKLSCWDMLDPFAPAYMLGYEQGFAKNFSLLLEAGPVSSFNGKWVMKDNIEGYKLRADIRCFIRSDDRANRFYLGWQSMYRHTVKPDLVGSFCRDNCNYYQEMEYDFVKNVTAVHFSMGVSAAVTQHFVLDVNGFIGLRRIKKWEAGIPDDATRVNDDFLSFNLDVAGDNTIPSIGCAFRIGFGW